MDWVFFCGVPVGCVMVYGLVHDAKRHARELKQDRRGWSDYAAAHGFRYATATRGYSHRAHHRIEGRVDGVSLSCTTGLGILQMPTTTLTAHAPIPIDGRLYVSCDEALSRSQGDLSARRVDDADPDFNGSIFHVKATCPSLARSVLVPAVRKLLVRMSDVGRQSLNFRCERDLVAVEWMGHNPIPELLDLGFDLLVAACMARTKAGAYR